MATDIRHILEALGCRMTLSEMRPEYVGKTFKGTVATFDVSKGFGFIDLTGDLDPRLFPARRVFFHISGITPRPRSNREAHLNYVGKNVVFTLAPNPRKQGRLFGKNVRLESAFPLTGNEEASPPNSTELDDSSASLEDVTADYDFLDLASLGLFNPLKDALENIITKDANKPGWRNLTLQEQNLKAEAIKLGFQMPLLDRAFASTDFALGETKVYRTIEDLVEELLILQESDSAELLGTFGSNEDFRLNSWIQQAEEMGFSPAMVLDALSTGAVPYEHFEDLIEQLMNMQLAKEQAQMAAAANIPDTEEKKVIQLRKENQDLRDYFLCKICFENEASVVFMPCGHCCSCQDCGVGQSECPICRKKTPECYVKRNVTVDIIIPPKVDRALAPLKEEITALEAENKSLRTNRACRICNDRDRTRFFHPCQHVVSCGQCSLSMVWCPVCKARVNKMVQIYSA